MSKTGKLTLKILLAVILNDFIDGFAQVLMKKGLVHYGPSPLAWAGIVLHAFNFFLWIGILSQIDLGLAVPLGSTVYVIVPVLALVLLHEKLTLLKCAGIFLIILGILFISKSRPVNQPVLTP